MAQEPAERGDVTALAPPEDRATLRIPDTVSGILFGLAGATILVEVSDYPPRPMGGYGSDFFPQIIAVGMLVVGVLMVLSRSRGAPAAARPAEASPSATRMRGIFSALLLMVLAVFSVFAIEPLGFVPTGFVVAFLFMLERRGKPLSSLAWSAAAVVLIYVLFTRIFAVILPTGIMPSVLT